MVVLGVENISPMGQFLKQTNMNFRLVLSLTFIFSEYPHSSAWFLLKETTLN
jgi:hypothetical protein